MDKSNFKFTKFVHVEALSDDPLAESKWVNDFHKDYPIVAGNVGKKESIFF